MKITIKTITSTLATIAMVGFLQAQSWNYLDAAGTGVNMAGGNGVSGRDLWVVSDNEVYTIMHASTNDQLEVYHYNGTSWNLLPAPNTSGEIIGSSVYVRKNSASSEIYISYSKFSGSGYVVIVKKYDGTTWSQVSTSLPLAAGSSYYGFELDANDVPLVIGSKVTSFEGLRVSKLDMGAWVHYAVPNSTGAISWVGMSYIDSQNNLIFAWQKFVSLTDVPANIDTLSGTTLYSTPENINMMFSGSIQLTHDGNGSQTLVNYKSIGVNLIDLKSYVNTSNTWTLALSDTLGWNGISAMAQNPNGNLFLGVQPPSAPMLSQLFLSNNFNTPVFEPSVSSMIFRIRTNAMYAYVLLANGVVREELSLITDAREVQTNASIGTIYPNPANETIQLQGVDNINLYQAKIFSIDGKIVYQGSLQKEFSVHTLTTGVYFLQILDNKGFVNTIRFVKK